MTFLAIGAATVAPGPGRALDRHGDGDLRVVRRREAMNHTWLGIRWPTSAVPVLPPTEMPSRAAAVPVPSSTTLPHHPRDLAGRLRRHDPRHLRAAGCRSTVRPSRSTMRSAMWGSMSRPPLATAAETIAICSGVTLQLVLADRHAPDVDDAAGRPDELAAHELAARPPLLGGQVDLHGSSKPRRLMYFAMVRLPSFSPTVAHAVFTEWVSASVSVMRPKSSPPKLRSGTPEIGFTVAPARRASAA